MAIPLNAFKKVVANVTNAANTIYTCPAAVTTVVLMAQVANIRASGVVKITAQHMRSPNVTRLVSSIDVPVNDAASILTGKLVMETGDGFNIKADNNDSAEITLSILETADQ